MNLKSLLLQFSSDFWNFDLHDESIEVFEFGWLGTWDSAPFEPAFCQKFVSNLVDFIAWTNLRRTNSCANFLLADGEKITNDFHESRVGLNRLQLHIAVFSLDSMITEVVALHVKSRLLVVTVRKWQANSPSIENWSKKVKLFISFWSQSTETLALKSPFFLVCHGFKQSFDLLFTLWAAIEKLVHNFHPGFVETQNELSFESTSSLINWKVSTVYLVIADRWKTSVQMMKIQNSIFCYNHHVFCELALW